MPKATHVYIRVYVLVRVVPLTKAEINEGEVGYYYDPYHRTISGIPLQ